MSELKLSIFTVQVTIVASPSSPRYRLQSDSLAALGPAINIILDLLSQNFSGEKVNILFTPPLPLNEYFDIIERHYKVGVWFMCGCYGY